MSVSNLTIHDETTIDFDTIHFSPENKNSLTRLLKEFKHIDALSKYDLAADNKILLYGHTGCGKTTTAKAIAKHINKKIYILDLSTIVSARLGETPKNVATVFKKAAQEKAVLFIDEFDYLGTSRSLNQKDSAEMQRLVNSIIQLIDYYPKDALLIAATNYSNAIDSALLRRFQLKLKFELPTKEELNTYYDSLLEHFPKEYHQFSRAYDISYAEAKDRLHQAIKAQIINEEEQKLL
ncbi:AAA family ATPase [Bizionia saleffrena]|uniref:AAA family ATPase n=1 Tax=Bizionia saleffrena TaxID=291189 RepID=A0A8H2LD24_9FLAO|nr:ATP-binding protein [Bizionia saleffrena]TYB72499.1 AAA family ATPase [Bizionia saleffrena]